MESIISKIPILLALVTFVSGCNSPIMNNVDSKSTPSQQVSKEVVIEECGKIGIKPVDQAGYHGIFPGKTNKAEVFEVLGEPDSLFSDLDGFTILEYPKLQIPIKDNKVFAIDANNEPISMDAVFSDFGCPDLVFLAKNEMGGIITFIVYYKNGQLFRSFESQTTLESIFYPMFFIPEDSQVDFLNSYQLRYLGDFTIIFED